MFVWLRFRCCCGNGEKMKNILVTGGAGFIGSNLVLALQKKYPDARLVVVDDFRSGEFKNLETYRGDFVSADVSRLDFTDKFHDLTFDAIFHAASITDTTVHDQRLQVHDNVEGFRRVLDFAVIHQTPVVYASSAATYGTNRTLMQEDMIPAPANIYAFSKVQLDNLARIYAQQNLAWKIVGLRYFNVYGMNEAHKQSAASMIYQLYRQMIAGKRPRVFVGGEQMRDFVSVKDVVELTIRAVEAPASGVYNCGSGVPFSFNDVIEALNSSLGTALEPEYIDNPYSFYQPHTEADMTRTQEELGFSPKFEPREGIADYVKSLQEG